MGLAFDFVELVTVQHHDSAAIYGFMDELFADYHIVRLSDFGPIHMPQVIVVIARRVMNRGAFGGEFGQSIQQAIVNRRPIWLHVQHAGINEIANKIQMFRRVAV